MTMACIVARVWSLRHFISCSAIPVQGYGSQATFAAVKGSTSSLLFSRRTLTFTNKTGTAAARSFCSALLVDPEAGDYQIPGEQSSNSNLRFPLLSPKEKKELRGYAHSLGKSIIVQQVGKAGVTESLTKAISDALEAREILKLKVLDNCPDEIDEVIKKIENGTQCQVVGKIGSVLTLYRPSLRKLNPGKQTRKRPQRGFTKNSESVRGG